MAFSRRPDVLEREDAAWRPMATYVLLGVIAAFFVAQLLTQDYSLRQAQAGTTGWGTVWPGPNGDRVHDWHDFTFVIGTDWAWRPWTLVTSTLSHGGVEHLFFNGLFLFFFGPNVERLVGRRTFLGLFFAAGAVSGVLQAHASGYMTDDDVWSPAVGALGASGALMLLMGILMVLTPKTQILLMFLPVPLWIGGILYAIIDILGALNPYSNVGNFAHLSGMAMGLVYGYLLRKEMGRRGERVVYH